MNIYDLTFTDGKRCRCLVMEPAADEQEDLDGVRTMFHAGYLQSMERIIAPPPDKLPWRRDGDCWRIGRFELRRTGDGLFSVTWPGGEASGGKDEVSAAVRGNWRYGA